MHVHLDCDTGVDDAPALAPLLGHRDVTLAGIGTGGVALTATAPAIRHLVS